MRRQGTRATSSLIGVVLLVMVLGACSSGAGTRALPAAESSTRSTRSTSPTSPSPSPTSTTADALSAYATAREAFSSARTSRFVVTTTVSWTSDETTTLKETVTVDAPGRLVDVRGRLTHVGKHPQRGSYEFVEAGDAVFAPTEGGGWRRVGKDELALFGRSAPRAKTSAMPEVLRSFIPLVDIGQGEVSGTVDVLDFVEAARFGSVFKQFPVTEALSGTVDAYVTVENGTIRKIRLEGRGGDYSAGTDRAAGELESLLFFTQVEVVVTSVDQAVKIPDPRGGTKTV